MPGISSEARGAIGKALAQFFATTVRVRLVTWTSNASLVGIGANSGGVCSGDAIGALHTIDFILAAFAVLAAGRSSLGFVFAGFAVFACCHFALILIPATLRNDACISCLVRHVLATFAILKDGLASLRFVLSGITLNTCCHHALRCIPANRARNASAGCLIRHVGRKGTYREWIHKDRGIRDPSKSAGV